MNQEMNEMTKRICLLTMIASNAAIVALALLSGCGEICAFEECSSDDPSGPVMYYELDGTWCDMHSPQTCLTVKQLSDDSSARYTLTRGLCTERGRLSGGLEFTPDTQSRVCLPGFTYGLWSAGGGWSAVGLDLTMISQSDGTDAGTVHAEDLKLEFRR